ncbi:MAG: uracil-DNA glycosylase family protein [Burkholderiaceae bacterium]|nr:uracil-DNA glycosylase family protein [Burkholderiaceae bacterium]
MTVADELVQGARALARAVDRLRFSAPVVHVYNPLDYAWKMHEAYLRRFGATRKRVVFVGMNPGPFGMMQTGVPFGEVAAVRDWMRLDAALSRPAKQHPKRPIEGMSCRRSEVSGQRVWGWAATRFGAPEAFFEHALVLNYCPLVFLADSGRNCTPDKLPAAELQPLQHACDVHLRRALAALEPQWAIGIGGYAAKRLGAVLGGGQQASGEAGVVRIGQILHPSPASPLANRGWAAQVDAQLEALGVLALLPGYRAPAQPQTS